MITNKKICAIIFDLDGVLVDTASIHSVSWTEICQKYGLIYSERCYELTKGRGRMQSLESILSENNATSKFSLHELERICDEKNQIYVNLLNEQCGGLLFDGVIDLLEDLKNKNVKLGLASSSRNAVAILKTTGIERYFNSVVTGFDVSRVKPFPDVYSLSVKQLGCQANEALAIEDALTGINSAINAGLTTIYIGKDKDAISLSDFNCISLIEAHQILFSNRINLIGG